jgi:hypothetical protein
MNKPDWRVKALVVGGVCGALLGLGAAYIYINSAQRKGVRPEIQPGEAVTLGLGLLTVLRQIASITDKEPKPKKFLGRG